jgi:hypothetical protein
MPLMDGDALAGDDIINLFHAVPSQYRRNATWLIPDTTVAKVRKLKDDYGRYLWVDGLGAAPATLQATFQFAAVGAQPALKLVWHQGDSKPPDWVESWGKRSCVFMGEKGMLLGNGKLLPEERFRDFTPPPATLPRSPGHWVEWSPEGCPYYPCHFEGQQCDFCYCPLYPCLDTSLGLVGEHVETFQLDVRTSIDPLGDLNRGPRASIEW